MTWCALLVVIVVLGLDGGLGSATASILLLIAASAASAAAGSASASAAVAGLVVGGVESGGFGGVVVGRLVAVRLLLDEHLRLGVFLEFLRVAEDDAVHDDVDARREVLDHREGRAQVERGVAVLEGRGAHRARHGDHLSRLLGRRPHRERRLPHRVRPVGYHHQRLSRPLHRRHDRLAILLCQLERVLPANLRELDRVLALAAPDHRLGRWRPHHELGRLTRVRLVDAPACRDAQHALPRHSPLSACARRNNV
mmetsp:Transcript_11059/g.35147  ORF Transcript_11059/g.35147 Transcript_11059/m.35147 type:complete len:254 (+) Transcript_11059:80-841(+)